jgi:uncharacterized membrane protein
MKHPIGAALLAATAALTLSGCMGDDYGYGGGVSLGYSSGYYGGDPYWGWYDDYYYPGAGYYIYDRGGRRYSWNDSQRRYWEGRRGSRSSRENWTGFRRDGSSAGDTNWQQRREAWRGQNRQSGQGLTDEQRQQRREAWQSRRQQSQGLTDDQRQQRREAWQAQRQSQSQSQPQSQGSVAAPTGDPAGRGNRGGRGNWGHNRGD